MSEGDFSGCDAEFQKDKAEPAFMTESEKAALDEFPFLPIIGRNIQSQMNSIFSLSLIVILIAVLIIKDLFSVRMAAVRVRK
ncbi:MAG: hypothetical protein DPW18_01925 [Chloroflexi bacterium]|nr:hypothetical protein [Chloroflexota bacterium]MDL1941148.1 hypothetical protein [Chloroflexi bacterium CFX2]